MESILRKKHYRGIFFLTVILLLLLSIVFRYFALPNFDEELNTNITKLFATLLDSLAASLIVTTLIGSFIFWLTPEIIKKSAIEVIEPKEINPLLQKSIADTKTWIYKGACGRYTRSKTLPSLAKAAKHEGLGREIRITVLNPNNDQLCSEYATYRRSLKSASKEKPWTEERVKEETIATIISALSYQYNEPLLRIDIHLAEYFSAFRIDISDQYAIITKEDKEASGLKADRGTYFYNSYKDEATLSERQSLKINYKEKIEITEKIKEKDLEKIIIDSKIISTDKLAKLSLTSILNSINSPKDPYST